MLTKTSFFLAILLALHYLLIRIGGGSGKQNKKILFFLAILLALHYLCIKQVMNWLLDVFDD